MNAKELKQKILNCVGGEGGRTKKLFALTIDYYIEKKGIEWATNRLMGCYGKYM